MCALRSRLVETLPPWFFFKFKGFFRCFIVLILRWFNHKESALFAVLFMAPQFVIMPTQPFGVRARVVVEGAIGFSMAGRGVTLVLRTSWFKRSSRIRIKEIAAIRVYSCRAFTSPCISGFRPSIKVSKSYFSDQFSVWLDKHSNLVWYSYIVEV
ncbi:hypothetical protein B296_00006363 [Ensete ventricosum]|uniref:Uncharacterized protein n=1 Tax=Ensete ventricosum TaxID=4639 RepID=A0A427B686_ENSVE|nr:hypothetical protein B296_00006363 [Ensete ventricosum]